MSSVGKAVGGFFDGLLGDTEPYDSEMSPEEIEARQRQKDLEAQQEAEKKALQDKLDQQRTAALRGRFSTGGGSGAGSDIPAPNSANNDAQAASLFTRITGRTDQ